MRRDETRFSRNRSFPYLFYYLLNKHIFSIQNVKCMEILYDNDR